MRRRSAARAQAWRAGWVSTCALTQQERHQRKGTSVENSYKDLFAIATLGDARETRKREEVPSRTPTTLPPPWKKRKIAGASALLGAARVAIKSWEEP